jgi:serine/threonine protein kinase
MSDTRYLILGTIGVGASSRVDKARDTLIDRTVVLKTFAQGFGSADLQKQFLREAQILGRLSHPNIISIYDLGTNDDGSAYLVTEFVPGKTLDAVLALKGPVPLARAGIWAGDLANALGRAHKAGIIHGDVKPANIFVTDDGQIKLGDFGIARFATQVSGAASLIGTPAYLSPEQIKGEMQDHRSDIFSVGIVLYQLATGVRPFDGSSVAAVCAQIVAMQPVAPSRHNPALPPEFDRIVMRCLAKDPADRYASGEALAASLYPFARSKPEPAPHRLHFSWLKGALRPAEGWILALTLAAALAAIPAADSFYRAHPLREGASRSTEPSVPSPVAAAANARAPGLDPPVGKESLPRTSTGREAAETSSQPPWPRGKRDLRPAPGASRAAGAGGAALGTADFSLPTAAAASTPTASANQPSRSQSRSAPAAARAASLEIEISSAIDSATLAVFADQQLLATAPLSVTRAGESLYLDRSLAAGPHEFRVALYRQDHTLQMAKEGLAELRPGSSNRLTVHVLRRAKMLVKQNAQLDILWPAPSLSPGDSATPDAKSAGSEARSKPAAPLVANSVPSSR